MKTLTFTIQEINDAWIEFCQPKYLVSKKDGIIEEYIGKHTLIKYDSAMPKQVFRTDFISFLIAQKKKND